MKDLMTKFSSFGTLGSFVLFCFLVPDALWAQDQGGAMQSLIGIALMVLIFFVFIIWPQSRKAKKHQELLKALEKGDEVVTQSGLYGKIHGMTERVITLEVAPNVRIRVERQSIAGRQAEEKMAS